MDGLLEQSAAQRQGRRKVPLPVHLQEKVSKVCEAFNKADTDGSGYIDADEFARLLNDLNPQMTPKHARTVFAAADINGDKKLNFKEFIEWLFSDVEDTGGAISGMVGTANVVAPRGSLKSVDPNLAEDISSLDALDVEAKIKSQFSNAYKSFLLTYPECAAVSQEYIEEQTRRLMAPEFEERMVGSFASRLDKDGNGTLSYQEVRGLILEVLQADDKLPPDEKQIREFFDAHNTAAFGKEMGSAAFLSLMRGINVYLMEGNLPALEQKWRDARA